MVISLRALGAAGAALALTGCASMASPGGSSSPSVGSVRPSASPAPSHTSAPPSDAPGASTAVVLEAGGLSGADFGSAESRVEALLTANAGQPDDTYAGRVCDFDDASPYGRQLSYGGAAFLFQSKAKGTATSPRTFTSWVINLDQKLQPTMKLADGYPAEVTFATLKTAFPKGKMTTITLGESMVHVFRTPSGIWYRGDDDKRPSDVGSGAMGACE
ncbi:MAG: hypothetical protein QM619_02160 [Micropruina sp.]|uniref:hypothetical protein n=1 Tax=Micropruina sp. TaxID=2737536 RepID=UPI0039E2EEE8